MNSDFVIAELCESRLLKATALRIELHIKLGSIRLIPYDLTSYCNLLIILFFCGSRSW
jgi:hypothetical protein